MKITDEDFGILAVCAIRYCQGRMSYMPGLVRGIIQCHIEGVTDKDLQILINDCEYQSNMQLWGDGQIDKQGWLEWKDFLIKEQNRRKA